MVPSRSALLALLDANANWVDAVNQAEPGFFAKSAQGQRPKVSVSLTVYRPLTPTRSSGLAAPTRAYQSRSSPQRVQATSLCTATLQSSFTLCRVFPTHPLPASSTQMTTAPMLSLPSPLVLLSASNMVRSMPLAAHILTPRSCSCRTHPLRRRSCGASGCTRRFKTGGHASLPLAHPAYQPCRQPQPVQHPTIYRP